MIVDHLQVDSKPESLPIRFTVGPVSKPPETCKPKNLGLKDVLEASRLAKGFADTYSRIPSAIPMGGTEYGPDLLLEATAKTILYYSEHEVLPKRVDVNDLPGYP